MKLTAAASEFGGDDQVAFILTVLRVDQ